MAEQQPATLRADATYVINGWASTERRKRAKAQANGDLWAELERITDARGVNLAISKVDAHMHPVQVINGLASVEDYLGNHLADAAAGAAADKALARSERAHAIAQWELRGFLVARRLAYIEAWHWQEAPEAIIVPPDPLLAWTSPDLGSTANSIRRMVDERGHHLLPRQRTHGMQQMPSTAGGGALRNVGFKLTAPQVAGEEGPA